LNEAKNYKPKWDYFTEHCLFEIKWHVKKKSD
jgi:hypothetical protein